MHFDWVPVESSAVRALCFVERGSIPLRTGYFERYGDLFVAYCNGTVYEYTPALHRAYETLLYAESVGRALNMVLAHGSGRKVGSFDPKEGRMQQQGSP
jgi:hypothetical protein